MWIDEQSIEWGWSLEGKRRTTQLVMAAVHGAGELVEESPRLTAGLDETQVVAGLLGLVQSLLLQVSQTANGLLDPQLILELMLEQLEVAIAAGTGEDEVDG